MAENADVLVDSSVWVDYFNGQGHTVKTLNSLIRSRRIVICGQIRQEVLQGSRDEKAFAKLEKQMSLWESAAEESNDFTEAARIFARLRWKGITVPPADCLIAALAIRKNLTLYSNDSDFDQIPHLQRYKP
jgi:predicted nucleic acid-binding protein